MHVGNVGFHVQLDFWKPCLMFQVCYKLVGVQPSLSLSPTSVSHLRKEKPLCLKEGAGESVSTSVTSNTSALWGGVNTHCADIVRTPEQLSQSRDPG